MSRHEITGIHYALPDDFSESEAGEGWRQFAGEVGEFRALFAGLGGHRIANLAAPEVRQLGVQRLKAVFPQFQADTPILVQQAPGQVQWVFRGSGVLQGQPSRGLLGLKLFPDSLCLVAAELPADSDALEYQVMTFLAGVHKARVAVPIEITSQRVFLCHNSKDKPQVRLLADRLGQAGFQPWVDERDLDLGANFVGRLEEALQGIRLIVLVLGEHGLGPWQALEYGYALGEAAYERLKLVPYALSEEVVWPPLATNFQGVIASPDLLLERLSEG